MPLTQSNSAKAFSHNVATEIRAGRPKAQAAAIAYATKRKNMKHDKNYSSDAVNYARSKA